MVIGKSFNIIFMQGARVGVESKRSLDAYDFSMALAIRKSECLWCNAMESRAMYYKSSAW
jgi:hypothetical protein